MTGRSRPLAAPGPALIVIGIALIIDVTTCGSGACWNKDKLGFNP